MNSNKFCNCSGTFCDLYIKRNSTFAQNFLVKNLVNINDKGEIDYEKVSELAGRVLEGTARITRLNREEEQGRIAGGRRNVEASLYIGAKADYDRGKPENSTETASKELIAKEYRKVFLRKIKK